MDSSSRSVTVNPLEQLASAIVLVDETAAIVEKKPAAVRIDVRGARVVLLAAGQPNLESAIGDAMRAAAAGPTHLIVVDPRGSETEGLLRREFPRAGFEFRPKKNVHLWVPGNKAITICGALTADLNEATMYCNAGVNDTPALAREREKQVGAATRFLAPMMRRIPWVTWSLAAISVVLFGLQMLWGHGDAFVSGRQMGALVRSLVKDEPWRLLAATVLHGSAPHLFLNMFALFGFGTFLERFLGWRRYVLLYVVAGLGGSIASSLRSSDITSVGASGGIWGLMVAGAVLVTFPRRKLPFLVSVARRGQAWTPVLINGAFSMLPGVDLLAHFGGGITGGLLMLSGLLTSGLPDFKEGELSGPRPKELGLMTVLAGACGLALLVSVVVSVWSGRAWNL